MTLPSNEELKRILKTEDPIEKMKNNLNSTSNFVLTYNDYINSPRDYGTGDFLSMMEAHVLTDIVDNPGTTVTELSKVWDRTASAISQTVRKLMKKDYVYRVNSEDNARVFFLYPTEDAKEFAKAHAEYDREGTIRNRMNLLKKFSEEEIETFYKVMEEYTRLMKKRKIDRIC